MTKIIARRYGEDNIRNWSEFLKERREMLLAQGWEGKVE
jgi:hypothetical protein